jgi:transposase
MLIRNSDELRSMTLEPFRWLMQEFATDPVIHDITPSHSSFHH